MKTFLEALEEEIEIANINIAKELCSELSAITQAYLEGLEKAKELYEETSL